MTSQAGPEKRRVGRPRKRVGPTFAVPPREAILAVAADLFAERGISEVSMMEISEEVGLGQSSLYYWFKRKELILAELLQQVNRLPLAFAKQLEARHESADLQLYRLIRFDVHTVCTFPLEITEIHRFSHRDPAAFETYWLERAQLIHVIERIVERGVSSATFSRVDAYLTAVTIIAQDESVQNWYPRPMQPALSVHPKVDRAKTYEPNVIAEFIATRTVAGLLTESSRLKALRKDAQKGSP
jgi:TetR/AcrR family transcriptional regulator